MSILAATSTGGVVVKKRNPGEAVVSLDFAGTPTINVDASVGTATSYSWWGDWNAYVNGATVQVAAQRMDVADRSPSPVSGGNPSQTSKAVLRCPPLSSSINSSLESAYSALVALLVPSCPFCDSSIFKPLGTYQTEFEAFLTQGHEFCDGTQSQEPGAAIGAAESTVAEYFQKVGPPPDLVSAVTAIGGPKTFPAKVLGITFWTFSSSERKKLKVFFAPANVVNNSSVDNESMEFHEALHGFSGLADGGSPCR